MRKGKMAGTVTVKCDFKNVPRGRGVGGSISEMLKTQFYNFWMEKHDACAGNFDAEFEFEIKMSRKHKDIK